MIGKDYVLHARCNRISLLLANLFLTCCIDPHRVYLINCLVPILNGLSTRRSVAARARQVSDMIEGHLSSLVDGEVCVISGILWLSFSVLCI